MAKQGGTRREFLEFMGRGSVSFGLLSGTGLLASCASLLGPRSGIPTVPFTDKDDLCLAPGLSYSMLIGWGDALNDRGAKFGFNNDYLQYFPLTEDDGLLCVNHEAAHSGWTANHWGVDVQPRTKAQVEQEMKEVGVSIVHIVRGSDGNWSPRKESAFNRRIDAFTRIPFAGGKILDAKEAMGTLANCAGGKTPWGTYLSCEENYDNFYGEAIYIDGKRRQSRKVTSESVDWFNYFPNPPEHYGWVVEVDPKTGASKKLVGLGRCAHECATVHTGKDGRAVVYSGDDIAGGFVYKFIASRKDSLDEGTLYVADTIKGQWLPIVWEKSAALKKIFRNQVDALTRLREAGDALGATPLDRPEDIEICPKTGAVFIACTNNAAVGNDHGSILKIMERGNDPFSETFRSEVFISGGSDTGFSCPDNLAFDAGGNLWMTSDISGSKMHKEPYTKFGNNGLFYIPMSGPSAGRAHMVASAPRDAELTGPLFSPDGKTLWLSVQHPGELTKDPTKPTSTWPTKRTPKPSVVCIRGPLLDQLTGVSG